MKITYLENKEGNILISTTRHDYVSDGSAFIDGGQGGYFRYNESNGYKLKESSVESMFQFLRSYLRWGSIREEDEVIYTPIKDLSTSHIKNILKNVSSIAPLYKDILVKCPDVKKCKEIDGR